MWDQDRYIEVKNKAEISLRNKSKTPYDFMLDYKKMINDDDFEGAKAITEVLKPLNYSTSDTHNHIPKLRDA